MKNNPLFFLLVACFVVCLIACDSANNGNYGAHPVARVYEKILYQEDLKGLVNENSTEDDSAIVVGAYVDRWIRDELMYRLAERNVSENLNIEKLVEDYRASLLRHNYEQMLISRFQDSIVTQQELLGYYQGHQEEFQLAYPILRAKLVILKKGGNPPMKNIKDWIQEEKEREELLDYCREASAKFILEDSLWFQNGEIFSELPPKMVSELNSIRPGYYEGEDEKKTYHLLVLEVNSENRVAPFSYVEKQIRNMILHQRRANLVSLKIDEFYEQEFKRNNIKIFD